MNKSERLSSFWDGDIDEARNLPRRKPTKSQLKIIGRMEKMANKRKVVNLKVSEWSEIIPLLVASSFRNKSQTFKLLAKRYKSRKPFEVSEKFIAEFQEYPKSKKVASLLQMLVAQTSASSSINESMGNDNFGFLEFTHMLEESVSEPTY